MDSSSLLGPGLDMIEANDSLRLSTGLLVAFTVHSTSSLKST